MKITPIISNYLTYNHSLNCQKANNCTKINNNCHDLLSFKASSDVDKIAACSFRIKDSDEFQKEIKTLIKNSLSKEVSLDDFLACAMRLANKYSDVFPIKEDFFEYKAKNRFVEIVKKCINAEITDCDSCDELSKYLNANYWWGFNDNKFGSSNAFAIIILSILPFARQYEKEIQISKLEHLNSRENTYRNTLHNQERELKNKEFINEVYFQPLAASKNDPTISLPNAIMIEGKNKKDNEELIGWTLSKTPSNKIAVENDKSSNNTLIKNRLKSALEKSKQTFEDYRIPTLIYCEEFDRLVQASNSPVEIASMKALLSNTYFKYGATIIFSTQNANKIDNVIKQPHRMKSINIDS